MTGYQQILERPASDVTIVGGGLGGIRSAQSLRRHGFTGSITVLGDEAHLPYDRPPLSKKFITGEVESHEILLCNREELDALRVELRTETQVVGLEPASKHIVLSSGTRQSYRKLVIATGATPKLLPGQPMLSNVCVLRDLADASRLRDAAASARQVCVIGGGVLGAEIAASLHSRGIEMTIVEAAGGLLARTLGTSEVASSLLAIHEAAGITVRLGSGVESLVGDTAVTQVRLTDGTILAADLIVVALGATPNIDWLTGSGLELDDGIVTDGQLRTNSPDVFAVGDVVRVVDRQRGTNERAEHWTSVVDQAEVVARNIVAGVSDELATHVSAPYVWSDQHGERIQAIGTVLGADDEIVIRHADRPHRLLSLFGTAGVFTGATAIGMPRPIARLRPMLAHGASFKEAVALGRDFA